jgi:hypothetical protein
VLFKATMVEALLIPEGLIAARMETATGSDITERRISKPYRGRTEAR